jgi:phage/plasmid-like protein (TIGR03299 family)
MSANINFNELTGRHSFVSKKELPWHRLGQIVEAMTSEEAIELGGLNFEVKLERLYIMGQRLDNHEVKNTNHVIKQTIGLDNHVEYYERKLIKDRYATVRTDNHFPLGVVGSRYTPIQNREVFDFFDGAIGEGHAQYETAGALGNGETVFVTAKLPKYIQVADEDIDSYLLLTTSHDGSGSIMAMFTPVRVVCNNTLSLAIGGATNKVVIRHTKSAKEKLDNLDKVLGMTNTLKDEMNNSFKILQDITIPDNIIEDLMIDCLGLKVLEDTGKLSTQSDNMLQQALDYYKFGFGQRDIQNTGWGILNGITGYLQNVKSFRSDESMFNSMLLKNGSTDAAGIRQKTFDKLISLKPKIYALTNVSN